MTGNGPSPSGRTIWTPIGPLGVLISSVRVCIPPLLCVVDAAATIGRVPRGTARLSALSEPEHWIGDHAGDKRGFVQFVDRLMLQARREHDDRRLDRVRCRRFASN